MTDRPTTRVFTGGAIADGVRDTLHDTIAVRGGHVAYIGERSGLGPDLAAGAEVIDLAGAAVTPGFVDGHAHVRVSTLTHLAIDLTSVRGAADLLAKVADAAHSGSGIVIGHGWHETSWEDPRLPTLDEIDQASGGREVYLARADIHSALISPALAERAGLRGLDGWNGTAHVSKAASGAAHNAVEASGSIDWAGAQGGILELAAARGIVALAENGSAHDLETGALPALLAWLTDWRQHGILTA
jgi:predicted amidohydrolase YtcJ